MTRLFYVLKNALTGPTVWDGSWKPAGIVLGVIIIYAAVTYIPTWWNPPKRGNVPLINIARVV